MQQFAFSDYLAYAECIIGLAALLVALLGGVTVLQRRSDVAGKLMGWSALILFIGYALFFAPRILAALAGTENAFWLLVGRMATALAVTVFFVLMSLLWEKLYEKKNSYYAERAVRDLAGIRALGCVGPVVLHLSALLQGEETGDLFGGSVWLALIVPAVRCVPLLIVALIVAAHWRKTRDALPTLNNVWLFLILSALFGIASDVGAVFVPALEYLYFPQLVCLLWIVLLFVRFAGETGEKH